MPPSRPSFFRRFFGSTAFFLNVLAAAWLLACFAAGYVSPLRMKYLALTSISSPFAVAVNVLFVLFWLLRRHKLRAVLSVIALAVTFRLSTTLFAVHYGKAKAVDTAGGAALKVLTWNVHGMGIFDRPRKTGTDERIIEYIREAAPDVVCLPEFYTIYSNALKPYSTTILNQCGFREFRFKYDNTLGVRIFLGVAVFSKYPLQGFETYVLHHDNQNNDDVVMLKADIEMPNGQMVRFFFTHLQSFMLSDGEKTYLEEVKHRDKDITAARSKTFVRRFGEAYVKRAVQADSAAKIIAKSPYPVVVCGDFNDLPGSYTYTTIKGRLDDAFVQGGRGFGRTYNLFSPTLRIDYLFYDPKAMQLERYESPKTSLSDHNPVMATFRLRDSM